MSKITTLRATGIKGRAFELNPKAVTLVTGLNMVGKTTRKNAFEYALLGYVPGLGKTNPAIFSLSNGEPMGVELEVDGKLVVSRLLKKSGKSVKGEEVVNIEVPPVMFDLKAVTEKSKNDRLAYLFNMTDAPALTMERITATVKSVKVDEPTEETEVALGKFAALANTVASETDKGKPKHETIQDKLEAILKSIKEQISTVNGEIKDLEGFVRSQTRLTDDEIEAPVNNAKAKVATAQEARLEAATKTNELQRQLNELRDKEQRLHDLRNAEMLTEETPAPVLDEEFVAGIDARIEETQAAIDDLAPIVASLNIDARRKELNDLSNTLAEHRAAIQSLKNDGIKSRTEIDAAKVERAKDAGMECCPTCAADGVTWKDKILQMQDQEIAKLEKEFGGLAAKSHARKAKLAKAKVDFDALSGSISVDETKHQELQTAQSKLTHLQGDKNKFIYAHQQNVQTHQEKHKQAIDAAARRKATIEELEKFLLSGDSAKVGIELAESQNVLNVATEQITTANEALRIETGKRADEYSRQKSIDRRKEAAAELVALKASEKALRELQREAIEEVFNPLLATTQRFTDGILKEPLAFHETELGYWVKGHFVGLDTMSGIENTLACLALGIALASASDAPLKVAMVDEMSNFESEFTRPALIKRMMELVADGVIDHFIGIDPDRRFCHQYDGVENVLVHEVTA